MNGLFSRLFHTGTVSVSGSMDRGYVSEFTRFMERYLVDHPEVVSDRRIGWRIYWDKQVDLKALAQAQQDSVPDDGYGFHPIDWTHGQGH